MNTMNQIGTIGKIQQIQIYNHQVCQGCKIQTLREEEF